MLEDGQETCENYFMNVRLTQFLAAIRMYSFCLSSYMYSGSYDVSINQIVKVLLFSCFPDNFIHLHYRCGPDPAE